MMRAISILQPWATLIAIGAKRYETRGWQTKHRGEVAICASKGKAGWRLMDQSVSFCHMIDRAVRDVGMPPMPYDVLGAVVAVASIDGVIPSADAHRLTQTEQDVGDWSPGRFGFHLVNVRRLVVPVPVKGALGLFTLPDDVEAVVRSALGS
jgi:hypothetical protein